MKKLLFVLLIVALASYLFVGCIPVTPSEGEGEGEGEGEVEGVTVAIADSVKVGNYTYVSAGSHDITVTFPAPVAGLVSASISTCSGDYEEKAFLDGDSVVLFPDATKKIWTGSGTFDAVLANGNLCCASYVEVSSGECAEVVCIAFPIIIDGDDPYATIAVSSDACDCDGCEVTFESSVTELDCADVSNCGDDCSGLASWSFDLYISDPFDKCCLIPCIEPVYTCSGVDCPILCTTSCIGWTDAQVAVMVGNLYKTYWVVETLADEVGNTARYYATIEIDSACGIIVTEYAADVDITPNDGVVNFVCTTFEESAIFTGTVADPNHISELATN